MSDMKTRHTRMSKMEKSLVALVNGLNERLASFDEILAALTEIAGPEVVQKTIVTARARRQAAEIDQAVKAGTIVPAGAEPAGEGMILRFETSMGTTFAEFSRLPEPEQNAVRGAKPGDTLSDGTQVTGAWTIK